MNTYSRRVFGCIITFVNLRTHKKEQAFGGIPIYMRLRKRIHIIWHTGSGACEMKGRNLEMAKQASIDAARRNSPLADPAWLKGLKKFGKNFIEH